MGFMEQILARSPAWRRLQAERRGDKDTARKEALDEFTLELILRFGADRADQLVKKYNFTREEIVKYATYAYDILNECDMSDFAVQLKNRYNL